ncbi:MAG TPA: stress response translation initiation inhibitor YciH, partial [Candidatus Methylomirabilis sp.]
MSGSRLVCSTVGGRVRQPDERPTIPDRTAAKPGAPHDGVIRIFRERGGRNGKVVTVVRGLPSGTALAALAADLKRLCGAGGTVKGGALEIQGDHRERLAERLHQQGYPV